MKLHSTFSTRQLAANLRSDWLAARLGVEFSFIGCIEEPITQITISKNQNNYLLQADSQQKQRSGRYGILESVPT